MDKEQEKFKEYEEYLKQHVGNVMKAYCWLEENLVKEITYANYYSNDIYGSVYQNISQHDASKRTVYEYEQYANYFNGEKTPEVKKAFDYAWNHHKHNNPHHWNYWVNLFDDGNYKGLEMPYVYVIEMICDWWAFSWSSGNLYEIFDWYEKYEPTMILHPNTKKYVEKILKEIREILDKTVDK